MRNSRVRDRSNIDDVVSWYLPVVLIFIAGAMGMLVGSLVGRISTSILGFAGLIFMAFVFLALLISWSINRHLVLMKEELAKEDWKQQHIALTMLISELQKNLKASNFAGTSSKAFEAMRYNSMFFSPLIYDSLVDSYERLESLRHVSEADFRKVVREEMNITNLIYTLQEQRLRIRNKFSYL